MIIRNPTGRPVRLEILTDNDSAVMTVAVGPHASVDLSKYQRALDAMAWANRGEDES